jgi:transcriptional regulator with XRE-family HTH domain
MGFRSDFGKAIKHARDYKGFTQNDLADYLKIQQPTYHYIETGQSSISAYSFLRLCKKLKIDPRDFLDCDKP